jgi:hypothetical protein
VGFQAGPGTRLGGGAKALNLLRHRALAVRLRVDGPAAAPGEPCAVLNVQLESGAETYREHYVDLDWAGERTIVIPEPTTERMLPEFRPSHANYEFKSAGYSFDYGGIVAVNLRWMRLPKGQPPRCSVALVEALAESDAVLTNPELAVGSAKLPIPVDLRTGDYAEFWGEGPIRVFDRNGVLLKTLAPPGQVPQLAAGENRIALTAAGSAPAKLTLVTLGEPLVVQRNSRDELGSGRD